MGLQRLPFWGEWSITTNIISQLLRDLCRPRPVARKSDALTCFFPPFLHQRRESVCHGQAETDCHEWQIGACHLTQRRRVFTAVMPSGKSCDLWPLRHTQYRPNLTSHQPACQSLSVPVCSLKGIHCLRACFTLATVVAVASLKTQWSRFCCMKKLFCNSVNT